MARTYRKKPVTVEAVQWTGENHAEMCEFIDPEVFEIIPRVGLVIHTLEGDHHASPGDYIIKGVNGEFYPCKPDIFAKTYASAALTPPNEWVSVEERLPDKPGHYLVCTNVNYWHGGCMDKNGVSSNKGTTDGYVYTTLSVLDCFYDMTGNWNRVCNKHVTHWMNIPAPPDCRPPEGEEDT